MGKTHTVKQGEHLTRIAKEYGFRNPQAIWKHPKNADLGKIRTNPNVLYPGDRLYIPDREPKRESGQTGATHRFQVSEPRLMLRLVLEDQYGKPIPKADCELRVEGQAYPHVTDEKGRVEQSVPAKAERAELVIRTSGTAFPVQKLPVRIGHLDPVETVSGQIARLNNLGYFAGPIEPVDRRMFRYAIEEFQCDHGLKVDGKCGPGTQALLEKLHGS